VVSVASFSYEWKQYAQSDEQNLQLTAVGITLKVTVSRQLNMLIVFFAFFKGCSARCVARLNLPQLTRTNTSRN
jgi:hypothetical protein